MKVTWYFRPPNPTNFSMEELFEQLADELEGKVNIYQYYVDNRHRFMQSISDAAQYQSQINHITGAVNYLVYALPPEKTIITIHDIGHYTNTLGGFKKLFYKKFWLQWPLARAKYVTAISNFTKDELIKRLGIYPDKIRVIHNPFPRSFIHDSRDFNTEKPRILQIGSGHNKNVERIIEAVEGINCKLILVRQSSPGLIDRLEKANMDYEIRTGLSFEGVRETYRGCDMLLFPSTYEGFGLPIVEAQAAGIPVITSNQASMPEVAGTGACFVNPFDVVDIRKAVRKVISEKEYRAELVQKGYDNIRRFDVSHIANQYLELYDDVLSGK